LAVALELVTVQARYAGPVVPIYSRLLNVNLNLVTPLRVLQQALPLLNAEGCVINIGSTARCFCRVGSIGYTVTKAAVEAMAPSLANELGDRRITVHAVASGVIRTDLTAGYMSIPEVLAGLESMVALGRVGEPEDMADVVGFLAGRMRGGSPAKPSTWRVR
jgi:NAD(P)-dependent dehydrogenase (short-subunit alcohol dehydrogenase family)